MQPSVVDIALNCNNEEKMSGCRNVKECICPKATCPNHGQCCKCVIKHRTTDSLPYCLFPNNSGDKSNKSYYNELKKRYENQ